MASEWCGCRLSGLKADPGRDDGWWWLFSRWFPAARWWLRWWRWTWLPLPPDPFPVISATDQILGLGFGVDEVPSLLPSLQLDPVGEDFPWTCEFVLPSRSLLLSANAQRKNKTKLNHCFSWLTFISSSIQCADQSHILKSSSHLEKVHM